MRWIFLLFAFITTISIVNAQETDQSNIDSIIVFDGSGSMWGQIDGTAKITIARDTLRSVLDSLPDQARLGLIAYGHNRKGDCNDIERMVPVGALSQNKAKISKAVEKISPRGKTPLSDAVKMAADDLKIGENSSSVILVTDGIETCEADPCALGNELAKFGINFKVHVIGFGLSEDEGKQVACLAENTGGKYLEASNASELSDALYNAVKEEPKPVSLAKNLSGTVSLDENSPPLTDKDGVRVFWSLIPLLGGEEFDIAALPQFKTRIEPGIYQIKARTNRGSTAVANIELSDDQLTEVNLVLGAGQIELNAVMENPNIKLSDTDFAWTVENTVTGEKFTEYRQSFVKVVPSGQYTATLQIKRMKTMSPGTIDLDVVTGEQVTGEIVAPTSKVLFRAFKADGSELKRFDIRFYLFKGSSTEDRSASVKMVIGGDPLYILPGEYSVRAEGQGADKGLVASKTVIIPPASDQIIDVHLP